MHDGQHDLWPWLLDLDESLGRMDPHVVGAQAPLLILLKYLFKQFRHFFDKGLRYDVTLLKRRPLRWA